MIYNTNSDFPEDFLELPLNCFLELGTSQGLPHCSVSGGICCPGLLPQQTLGRGSYPGRDSFELSLLPCPHFWDEARFSGRWGVGLQPRFGFWRRSFATLPIGSLHFPSLFFLPLPQHPTFPLCSQQSLRPLSAPAQGPRVFLLQHYPVVEEGA